MGSKRARGLQQRSTQGQMHDEFNAKSTCYYVKICSVFLCRGVLTRAVATRQECYSQLPGGLTILGGLTPVHCTVPSSCHLYPTWHGTASIWLVLWVGRTETVLVSAEARGIIAVFQKRCFRSALKMDAPPVRKGLMQHWPLLTTTILEHARNVYSKKLVVTNCVEGGVHRYDTHTLFRLLVSARSSYIYEIWSNMVRRAFLQVYIW
eukprot:1187654-Prorocentrum_minimum.AAC.1